MAICLCVFFSSTSNGYIKLVFFLGKSYAAQNTIFTAGNLRPKYSVSHTLHEYYFSEVSKVP